MKIITLNNNNKEYIKNIEEIGKKSLPIHYTYDDLLKMVEDNKFTVNMCIDDNILIGFIIINHIEKNRNHIMSIGVSTEYRRKGVGKQLINTANNQMISLYVQYGNDAIKFYKKLNFQILEKLENYYDNLEEKCAYFMIKFNK